VPNKLKALHKLNDHGYEIIKRLLGNTNSRKIEPKSRYQYHSDSSGYIIGVHYNMWNYLKFPTY
jgi:hypothetical protein